MSRHDAIQRVSKFLAAQDGRQPVAVRKVKKKSSAILHEWAGRRLSVGPQHRMGIRPLKLRGQQR